MAGGRHARLHTQSEQVLGSISSARQRWTSSTPAFDRAIAPTQRGAANPEQGLPVATNAAQ
jgi:hypothetical protein